MELKASVVASVDEKEVDDTHGVKEEELPVEVVVVVAENDDVVYVASSSVVALVAASDEHGDGGIVEKMH